jgi:predicted RNA methylase
VPALAGGRRPKLVVDLGAGTGLSTRVWATEADSVVGVEPNDAMRCVAERATRGFSETDLALDRLREAAARWLPEAAPWWLSYRLVVALK